MSDKPDTPELDKQIEVKPRAEVAGDFLEWAFSEGYHLCRYDADTDEFYSAGWDLNKLMAGWLGIDLAKTEQERRSVLKWLGEQHQAAKEA